MKGMTKPYKLADGSLRYLYAFGTGRGADGKHHQQWKRGFKTKREADDALAEALAEFKKNRKHGAAHEEQPVSEGRPVKEQPRREEQTSPLFKDAFGKWLEGHSHWEPSTRETNMKRGGYALTMFGDTKLNELTAMQIHTGLELLRRQGGNKGKALSAKTCHAVYALMRQYFRQMIDLNQLAKNPMIGVKAPPGAGESQAESLTLDEFDRLLDRLRFTRYYAMAFFGSESGMRCGELLALRWSHVDFMTGDISVCRSLQYSESHGLRFKGTKTNKIRTPRVGTEALDVLREHRAVIERDKQIYGKGYSSDHDLVFCQPDGRPLSPKHVSARMGQFMREVGIEKSLHKLRHFCGTFRLAMGESVPAVAAHLGHDPNVLLKIYAHVLPGDKERGVSLWSQGMQAHARKRKPSSVAVMPEASLLARTASPDFVSTGVSTKRLKLVRG